MSLSALYEKAGFHWDTETQRHVKLIRNSPPDLGHSPTELSRSLEKMYLHMDKNQLVLIQFQLLTCEYPSVNEIIRCRELGPFRVNQNLLKKASVNLVFSTHFNCDDVPADFVYFPQDRSIFYISRCNGDLREIRKIDGHYHAGLYEERVDMPVTHYSIQIIKSQLCTVDFEGNLRIGADIQLNRGFDSDRLFYCSCVSISGKSYALGSSHGSFVMVIDGCTLQGCLPCESDITALQFSKDEKFLFAGTRNGNIFTYSLKLGKTIAVFHTPKQDVTITCIRNLSSGIAVGGTNSSLLVWRTDFLAQQTASSQLLESKSPALYLRRHVSPDEEINFDIDADEKLLVSGGEDGYLRLWSLETGELLRAFEPPGNLRDMEEPYSCIHSCKFVEDGVMLCRDDGFEFWRFSS